MKQDCPNAEIYLIGIMPIYIVAGMNPKGNFANMYPSPRFSTMEDISKYEFKERYPKLELIKEVGKKYGLPVIDLWMMSGITNENAKEWYGEVADDCTQVHPNKAGNRRIAECIKKFIYSYYTKFKNK